MEGMQLVLQSVLFPRPGHGLEKLGQLWKNLLNLGETLWSAESFACFASPLLKAHDFAVLGASGHESSYRHEIVSQFVQVFRWLTLAAAYWHSQSNKWQVMIPPSALGSLLLLSRRKPLVLMLALAGVISCQPEYQLTVRLKPPIHAILAQEINQGESLQKVRGPFCYKGMRQWISLWLWYSFQSIS